MKSIFELFGASGNKNKRKPVRKKKSVHSSSKSLPPKKRVPPKKKTRIHRVPQKKALKTKRAKSIAKKTQKNPVKQSADTSSCPQCNGKLTSVKDMLACISCQIGIKDVLSQIEGSSTQKRSVSSPTNQEETGSALLCPQCYEELELKRGMPSCVSCQIGIDWSLTSPTQENIQKPLDKTKPDNSAIPNENGESTLKIDLVKIKEEIEQQLHGQRKPIQDAFPTANNQKHKHTKGKKEEYILTGIEGFDSLLERGIPRSSAVLVAGGAGSGKTIFTLQSMIHHAQHGEKCLYMSFEESEERLINHMEEFGWEPRKLIKKGKLMVKRFNPFEITRSVDALLMKAKGELLIDVQPIIFPKRFKPSIIVVDSLTAIASAFTGKEDSYRIYIEQLFRFFEEIGATSFLITETKQVPTIFSTTGVEEFLADAVVVMYNIKRENVRERAIEILKLRGAAHQNKIVAMHITSQGMEVFPEQEIFGGIEQG